MELWIRHLVEPSRLILTWQAPPEVSDRARWAVGEITMAASGGAFRYYSGDEFVSMNTGRGVDKLAAAGFGGYPAFPWSDDEARTFRDALGAFLRRITPVTRHDFGKYLERFHLQVREGLSGFALLAITGAALPSDGFSFVDPLDESTKVQDVVVEVMGYKYNLSAARLPRLGAEVSLIAEPTNEFDGFAVRLEVDGWKIGYVHRLQSRVVSAWLSTRSLRAVLCRFNGTIEMPRAFMFIKVRTQS